MADMNPYLIFALVGVVAGVLAGLFGIGGGLVLVPVLIALFAQQQFNPEISVHLAIGTSLAIIVFNASVASWSHHQRHAVLWPVVQKLSLGLLVGAWLGAMLAKQLAAPMLKQLFGLFEILIGLYLMVRYQPQAQNVKPQRGLLLGVGLFIGFISALLGIGGGTLTTPFLLWRKGVMQQAVATAAACGLPIALAGTLGFVVTGWQQPQLPALTTGYVYWPAVLAIALFSFVGTHFGVILAHRLQPQKLKQGFAFFLCGVGFHMLLK
jgi:uncharacterized membrane protein YfcA